MSKWNAIAPGRRAWALRDLSRRWCLGVGAGPSRRVAAKGFSPEAYRARQIMPKRPADAAWMGTRLQLDGDRIRINTPAKCDLKIPLPIPCRGRRIPLPDDTQIKSIKCLNHRIIMELSAMRGEFRASAAMLLAYSPCRQGHLERGAPAPPPGRWRRILHSRRSGPTSISNNRSSCIGRSPRCGSGPPGRISGIARTRPDATADR